MNTLFLKNIQDQSDPVNTLPRLNDSVNFVADIAVTALRSGGKLMLCGNGGSAADSQHLAAKLTGRFAQDRRPLAAIALSIDTSASSCIGNDYSFDEIFARQVVGLGREVDLPFGISTSGNSRHVIRAVEEAKKLDMATVCLLGRDGGVLRTLYNHSIVVPSRSTARVQECHILNGHTICGLIEQGLGFD